MGIKRRIISSGRKFYSKHEDFYTKWQERKDGTGVADDAQLFAWVDSVTLTDNEDGTFDLAATVEGDFEVTDAIGYSIDGAAYVILAANTLTAASIAAADGERSVTVRVYRGETDVISKSEKTATVEVTGNP